MPKVKEITSLLQKYLSPYVKQVIFLAVILISYNALQVLFPQILRIYVEAVSAPSLDVKVLLYSSIIYIGMSVIFRALYILLQKISQELAWATTNNLRIDMTRHCINLDMTFHNRKKTGDMIERIDGDASTLSEFFSTFIHYFIGSFFLVLGILVAVFIEGWVYGLLFLAFIMIALTAFYFVRKIASPLWKKVRESTTALFGSIEESISGLEDIRGNGAEPFIMKRFHEVSQINFKDKNKAMIYSRIYYIINVLMGAMINLGILMISYYFAGYLTTSSGTLYMLLTYGTNLLRPLRLILWQLEQLQNSMANIDRVNEYFSLESKIVDKGTKAFPVEEVNLSFENVNFGYSEDAFVLKGVSFSIPHGRTLGLIGRTGSGKTTLARLLFRLYDPNEGAIKINGIDIRNFKLKELRANVSYITQEVELFKASIKDNVTFFNKNYSEKKVEAIVNEVGLGSWLEQLPKGLETEIYSEDCGLSAGEEQLLALSRAFLKNPKIVILDEASSRLDPATEQQIDLALEKLLLGRTGIIIAHRLSTLHKVDDILILSKGEILEYGPREELLRNPNSHFSRLLQKGAEEILI